MYKLSFISIFFICFQLHAQDSLSLTHAAISTSRFLSEIPFNESGYKQSLSINGGVSLQGNAIDGYTLKHFLVDAYINDDSKATINNHLNKYNYAYYNQQLNIKYYRQTSLKWFDWFALQASKAVFAKAAFSSDAFVLATSGNAAFENKTAVFDNTTIQFASFYSAGTTLVFKFLKGHVHLGLSGDGIEALNGTDLNINKGSIYTAPNGEYIDASIKGALYTTDTSSAKRNSVNGYGYRVGGFIEWQADDDDIFTLSAQNIGRIFWNNASYRFNVDTTIHFSGYNVTSLFNSTQSGLSYNNDSIAKTFHVKSKKLAYMQNLIPQFSLQYIHIFRNINTVFGVKATMYDNWQYNTSVKVFGQYHFKHNWNLGASVTYYAGNIIGTGVLAGKSWKHIHIYLSSDNLLQYWRISRVTNENILAQLSYSF